MPVRICHAVITPATAANTRIKPAPHCPPRTQTTPTPRATKANAKEALARREETPDAPTGNRPVFSLSGLRNVTTATPPNVPTLPPSPHQRAHPTPAKGQGKHLHKAIPPARARSSRLPPEGPADSHTCSGCASPSRESSLSRLHAGSSRWSRFCAPGRSVRRRWMRQSHGVELAHAPFW